MAGSAEFSTYEMDEFGNEKVYYFERKGWISWLNGANGNNVYDSKPTGTQRNSSWHPVTASMTDDESRFAITNGALGKFSGDVRKCYICPTHQKICKANNVTPTWSYVMNSRFGYDVALGGGSSPAKGGIYYGSLSRPDKMLLFAELPAVNVGAGNPTLTGSKGSSLLDCTLQYDDGLWVGKEEFIGFNHTAGGKSYVAHIVFADGHLGALALPSTVSATALSNLTKLLCNGDDIIFSGGQYSSISEDMDQEQLNGP